MGSAARGETVIIYIFKPTREELPQWSEHDHRGSFCFWKNENKKMQDIL